MIKYGKGVNMQISFYNFIDSYKHLDQLCKDIFGIRDNSSSGISEYIEEMEKSFGSDIAGWNSDLQKLKYARRIRNKLVHETNTTIDDFPEIEGILFFLTEFYDRIINGCDPLTLQRKKHTQKIQDRNTYPDSGRKTIPQPTRPEYENPYSNRQTKTKKKPIPLFQKIKNAIKSLFS